MPRSYQPITQRAVLKLPNHAKVAVWVVIQLNLNSHPEIAKYTSCRNYSKPMGI
ncbi:hypothetical protein [Nodularia sp. NIES-3585]|uniref:hypothetical protein n=1 Tax=Nodularia sp. NIES-3585 TaxID=1973477 RepID=UPI0015958362|nr:hypothetical protein [Nodularia sp. NIES-3585]